MKPVDPRTCVVDMPADWDARAERAQVERDAVQADAAAALPRRTRSALAWHEIARRWREAARSEREARERMTRGYEQACAARDEACRDAVAWGREVDALRGDLADLDRELDETRRANANNAASADAWRARHARLAAALRAIGGATADVGELARLALEEDR